MRHMLLIDKLYLVLDFGLGALETVDDIPPQLKQKIDKLIDDTKKDLSDLSDWIMHTNSSININNNYNNKDNDLEDADIRSLYPVKGINIKKAKAAINVEI